MSVCGSKSVRSGACSPFCLPAMSTFLLGRLKKIPEEMLFPSNLLFTYNAKCTNNLVTKKEYFTIFYLHFYLEYLYLAFWELGGSK